MAVAPALEGAQGGCGSQFFITLADGISYLDGRHAVFGHVVEGEEEECNANLSVVPPMVRCMMLDIYSVAKSTLDHR